MHHYGLHYGKHCISSSLHLRCWSEFFLFFPFSLLRCRPQYIVGLFRFFGSCSIARFPKWHGRITTGCEKPLQIPIVLPSLCFRGNSLLPSGRPSSLSSSHFPLMGFSSVLFPFHFRFFSFFFQYCFSFCSQRLYFLGGVTFSYSNLIVSPRFLFLLLAFSRT